MVKRCLIGCFLCIYVIIAIELSCGKNKRERVSSFIVDGNDAIPNVWPWQSAHLYFGDFHCGGTLIHPQFIVTAAHCLEDRNIDGMSVRLGDHKRLVTSHYKE